MQTQTQTAHAQQAANTLHAQYYPNAPTKAVEVSESIEFAFAQLQKAATALGAISHELCDKTGEDTAGIENRDILEKHVGPIEVEIMHRWMALQRKYCSSYVFGGQAVDFLYCMRDTEAHVIKITVLGNIEDPAVKQQLLEYGKQVIEANYGEVGQLVEHAIYGKVYKLNPGVQLVTALMRNFLDDDLGFLPDTMHMFASY